MSGKKEIQLKLDFYTALRKKFHWVDNVYGEIAQYAITDFFLEYMQSYADQHLKDVLEEDSKKVVMKFKDAPIGARFHFIGDDSPKDVYVKIHSHGDGLVVKWNGNIQGYQSHCCWIDEENGYDFETEIEVI